jgi:rod shape determining protein RodA
MKKTFLWYQKIDWWIVGALIPLLFMSVSTLGSFDSSLSLMSRQLVWIAISFGVFFVMTALDFSFLKKTRALLWMYGGGIIFLLGLFFVGSTVNGAQSWYSFGALSFQPADMVKLLLILVLAKYLARRHVAIRSMKHVVITALYFLLPFMLIFLQPDFGSAIILFFIWIGMILVSGLSKRHIFLLCTIGAVIISSMWLFVFHDYQKNRIRSFIDPLSDIQGTGYNAYQSTIAVGSGEVFGKGVGYGTQSRLSFLPEYETDFIFAAFSEEWGFVGSSMVLLLFLFILIRMVMIGYHAQSNFELFFALGLVLYYMSHILVNVGMNIGLMPVTGVTLPFLSYGGSHLLVEFAGLGILMSMNKKKIRVPGDKPTELFLR